jgi:hypothetical protein
MLSRTVLFLLLAVLSKFAFAAYFTNVPASPNTSGSYSFSWASQSSDVGAYYLYETLNGTTTQVYSGNGSRLH